MTRNAVTVYDSYHLIDTRAWLQQRLGAHHSELSTRLQNFTGCPVFDHYQPARDLTARMPLWCAANGLVVGDGAVIEHHAECLTTSVTVVLAATGGPRSQAVALVSVDGGTSEVYTDDGYWPDAATIEIAGISGFYRTWNGGAHLHPAGGGKQPPGAMFRLGVPVISRCRDCTAFDDGTTDHRCPCPGVAIDGPDCGKRCRARLPEVPTVEGAR